MVLLGAGAMAWSGRIRPFSEVSSRSAAAVVRGNGGAVGPHESGESDGWKLSIPVQNENGGATTRQAAGRSCGAVDGPRPRWRIDR